MRRALTINFKCVLSDSKPQAVLNLLKSKENVNVPLSCPAAKKPQQIVAAQPKPSSKPKVPTHTCTMHAHTHTHTAVLILSLFAAFKHIYTHCFKHTFTVSPG